MTVNLTKRLTKPRPQRRKEYTLKANHTHRGKRVEAWWIKIELTSSQAFPLREKLVCRYHQWLLPIRLAAVKEG